MWTPRPGGSPRAENTGRLGSDDDDDFCFCFLLVASRPSNMRVYLRDGSAQTILRAVTLR